MSEASQVRLIITPLPQLIAWEFRDGSRRLGCGWVARGDGDWAEVRGAELRAGVARVELDGPFVDADARTQAALFGWRIAA